MDYLQVHEQDEEGDMEQEVPMFCSQPPILATKSTQERLNTTGTQRIELKLKPHERDSVDSLDKETQRTVSEQQYATVSDGDTKTFQTGEHARDFIDDKQSDFEKFLDGDQPSQKPAVESPKIITQPSAHSFNNISYQNRYDPNILMQILK